MTSTRGFIDKEHFPQVFRNFEKRSRLRLGYAARKIEDVVNWKIERKFII